MSDDIIEKPKIYTERSGVIADKTPFLFISYSHRSSQSVYADLNALYERGLNFWYDDALKYGDEWDKIVERQLSMPNCMGAIFFFDINSLCGNAIETEINYFERINAEKKDKFAFCIIDNGKSVYSIICDMFTRLNAQNLTPRQLQAEFPERRLLTVLGAFRDNKIYVTRTGSYIDDIINNLYKMAPGTVHNDKRLVDVVTDYFGDDALLINGVNVIRFGAYPQSLYNRSGEIYFDDDVHVLPNGDKVLFCRSGEKYLFEPLEWTIIKTDVENGFIKLMSTKMIETSTGDGDNIKRVLSKIQQTAFTQEQSSILYSNVALPSAGDFEAVCGIMHDINSTRKVLNINKNANPWLTEKESGKRRQLSSLSESGIQTVYNNLDAIGGIMPVIRININKLTEDNDDDRNGI